MKMPALLILAPTAAAKFFAETSKVETLALGSATRNFKLPGVDGKNRPLADLAVWKE